MLLRAAGAEDATAWIERVREHLRPSARTTFSAGLAVQGDADPLATTLHRADTALYAAKRAGRDRTCRAPDPVPHARGAAAAG